MTDGTGRHRYCAYYCEENVWQLCDDAAVVGSARAAIVISNPWRKVGIRCQRAAPTPGEPVVWDYHVILAAHARGRWSVWDLDSTLGAPVPLSTYLRASFDYPEGFGEPLAARFRVVEAQRYRTMLCTDRRHMRNADGAYLAPPPAWPTIGEGSNLMQWVDMEASFEGDVVELAALPAALDRLLSP
ncbi:MAG: hypothetical protein K0V04_06450 [Deltaproteobacteria bacterium]|nr:hypothetical protein [Deltaproteobacteria bacterium]